MVGHTDLPKLALAVEHDVVAKRAAATPIYTPDQPSPTTAPEIAHYAHLRQFTYRTVVTKFHGDRDNLRRETS